MPHRLTVSALTGSAAVLLAVCALAGLPASAWGGQDRLHLILQLVLPVGAFALGFGGMLAASRRVIASAARNTVLNPFVKDSVMAAGCAAHNDEVSTVRREAASAATRQPDAELNIAELEQQVRQMLSQFAGATGASLTTSDGMSVMSGATERSLAITSQSSDAATTNQPEISSAAHVGCPSPGDIGRQTGAATADQIGAAVDVINDMACESNLLALNAAIDAVRSSEAGRGFAATASEVDSLAGQTIEAANQISTQIAEITAALVALSARQGGADQRPQNTRNVSRDIVGSSAMQRMLVRKT